MSQAHFLLPPVARSSPLARAPFGPLVGSQATHALIPTVVIRINSALLLLCVYLLDGPLQLPASSRVDI